MKRWFEGPMALALAALLAGCGSLPRINPDMARRNGAPVQLDGAGGSLSAQQSKAVLDRLKSRGPEATLLDRHLAFEEAVSGSPLTTGNKVTLLVDGPKTYEAMFDAIASARDHINMETYILEDDEVGKRFADTLPAKQAAGVQVNAMYDSVGALDTPKAFFQRLTDGGIKVREYNPVNPLAAKAGWDVNERDHRKMLVVDGQIVILGGINISNYFPTQRPGGNDVVRAIGSTPDEPCSQIYATLISAIQHAQTDILLTNAYFVPDPQLLASLKEAAGRGVEVKLMLPSHSDSWLVLNAGRRYYGELLRSGVKLYERRDALLHSKTAVIDGVWSTVGSTNLGSAGRSTRA